MEKLNYTKEQIDMFEGITTRTSKPYTIDIKLFAKDWLTMFNELARLNEGLREAMDELETTLNKSHEEGEHVLGEIYEDAYFILRKHGLVQEDK